MICSLVEGIEKKESCNTPKYDSYNNYYHIVLVQCPSSINSNYLSYYIVGRIARKIECERCDLFYQSVAFCWMLASVGIILYRLTLNSSMDVSYYITRSDCINKHTFTDKHFCQPTCDTSSSPLRNIVWIETCKNTCDRCDVNNLSFSVVLYEIATLCLTHKVESSLISINNFIIHFRCHFVPRSRIIDTRIVDENVNSANFNNKLMNL